MPRLISDKYREVQQTMLNRFNQLKANEEELNRIFIDIYGLQGELTPEVADKDVTVYRVIDEPNEEERKMAYVLSIKPQTTAQTLQRTGTTQQSRPSEQAQKAVASSTQSDANVRKIKELEERIAALQREHDSIKGLFGFVKKNKIKKEMQELQQELYSIRNQ